MEKIKKIPNKIVIGGYLILIFAVIIIFTCAIAPVTNRESKGKDTYGLYYKRPGNLGNISNM